MVGQVDSLKASQLCQIEESWMFIVGPPQPGDPIPPAGLVCTTPIDDAGVYLFAEFGKPNSPPRYVGLCGPHRAWVAQVRQARADRR